VLDQPGVYTLTTGAGNVPIAVNVPAEEADVHTIDNAAIKSALGNIDLTLAGDQPPTDTAIASMANDWGWTVMLILLVAVGLESFMAMHFGHFRGR
jgi:hypothetical protein